MVLKLYAVLPHDVRKINRDVLIFLRLMIKLQRSSSPSLRKAGFCAGIAYIPVLPFISDFSDRLEEMIYCYKSFDPIQVWKKDLLQNFRKYKKLFKDSNKPQKNYLVMICKRAEYLCKKYGVRYNNVK